MYTDVILVLKGLAVGINRLQAQHGGLERVDALMGRASRMGCPAHIAHLLDDAAIAGPTDTEQAAFIAASLVRHQANIDVIKSAKADQLRLATKELDFTLVAQS